MIRSSRLSIRRTENLGKREAGMRKRENLRGRPGPWDSRLLDRLVEYGQKYQLNDMDGVLKYLRRKFPEYRRKQAVPFRKYLALQFLEVRRRIETGKQEKNEARNVPRSRVEEEEDRLPEPADAHVMEIHGVGDMNEETTGDEDAKGGGCETLPGSSNKLADHNEEEEREMPAFAPPPVVAATNRSLIKSPPASTEGVIAGEERDSPSGSSGPVVKTVSQLGSVVLQGNRPYLPLVPINNNQKLESTGGVQEGKLIRKREREREKARAGSKKGRWEEGDRPEVGSEGGASWAAAVPRNVSFRDFGGIEEVLTTIRELIENPLLCPYVYNRLGVLPPRGVLLHGPPGCGKTMLANAIAVETGVPFLSISASEVVSGMSGEAEAKVRSLFADAVKVAPCIVFIDEIDAITPKRETAHHMEKRIVAQFLTCIDGLSQPLADVDSESESKTQKLPAHVIVIGATNNPDALDPALRRPGRFDREIALGIPDENARVRILSVLSRKLRLEGSFDFARIARRTPGFVGADLAALSSEAATLAVKRIFSSKERRFTTDVYEDHEKWKHFWTDEQLEHLAITMEDFENAVEKVQPSAKREGFATVPDVTWEDVGSLVNIRKVIEFSICRAIKYREEYQALGMDAATGVLLYGPPGCGKTLVAKAIANDAGVNFISVKGPELLNKYVGESERAVRQLFTRARATSPCILFFDEMDAMAPRRGSDGNGAAERVVNQLLAEMDGLEQRKSIFIIAATNRPDMLDPALLRPGRLETLLYVPVPDPKGRASILRTLVRKTPLAPDVDVSAIGESDQCEGFSGADLRSLVREACIAALMEKTMMANESDNMSHTVDTISNLFVTPRHFEIALTQVFPSVSYTERKRYEALRQELGRSVSSSIAQRSECSNLQARGS